LFAIAAWDFKRGEWNKMQAPIIHTIDEKKVSELLKVADPYLKNYVRALKDVSAGWERLFHDAMKKIRELAAQDNGSRSSQATNTALDADSLSRLRAEIAALVNELNSGLSTVPAINLVCIALNKLRKLSTYE
jgi:predicted metal-dependent HD superfamily phosphohydrolase